MNQEFLAKKWQVETNPKTGTSTYKEPSVIVIYRKDQEFVLKDVIPKKNNGKTDYDLIIASQPYRSRVTAEKKVKYVIEPMIRALKPKGKLLTIHAAGMCARRNHSGADIFNEKDNLARLQNWVRSGVIDLGILTSTLASCESLIDVYKRLEANDRSKHTIILDWST